MTDQESMARIREKYRGLQGDMPPFGDVITLLRVLDERGWQPIETAPKGRVILLWAVTDRSEEGEVRNWKMATGSTPFAGPVEWTWDGYRLRDWDVQPTHWQPLPEPPVSGERVRDEQP